MIKKRKLLNGKKGNIGYPIVIFIILNLIFFSILLLFVHTSSTGALIYEQAYAKQIGLMIDRTKPNSDITINFKEGIEVAEKNNQQKENLVSFKENKVIVKLSSSRGYSFAYFSDYDVSSKFDGDNLIVSINENEKTG